MNIRGWVFSNLPDAQAMIAEIHRVIGYPKSPAEGDVVRRGRAVDLAISRVRESSSWTKYSSIYTTSVGTGFVVPYSAAVLGPHEGAALTAGTLRRLRVSDTVVIDVLDDGGDGGAASETKLESDR